MTLTTFSYSTFRAYKPALIYPVTQWLTFRLAPFSPQHYLEHGEQTSDFCTLVVVSRNASRSCGGEARLDSRAANLRTHASRDCRLGTAPRAQR